MKYTSFFLKTELLILDLTVEESPHLKLRSLLQEFVIKNLKSNKNAILFINLKEIAEEKLKNEEFRQDLANVLLSLGNLEKGYEPADLFSKETLNEYIHHMKFNDNCKHLNHYHHLYLLQERLKSKLKVVFNMDLNHFLKQSFLLQESLNVSFFNNLYDSFKNYTRFYIYNRESLGSNAKASQNISPFEPKSLSVESSSNNFQRNIEQIFSFNEKDQFFSSPFLIDFTKTGLGSDFLKKAQLAYLLEMEQSKFVLKTKKKLNIPLSFQQFFTLITYTYEKIKGALESKFEKEKKTGFMGKVFDLQNTKFEKFNKELTKSLNEKDKLEEELGQSDMKQKNINKEIENHQQNLAKIEENLVEFKKKRQNISEKINENNVKFDEISSKFKKNIEEFLPEIDEEAEKAFNTFSILFKLFENGFILNFEESISKEAAFFQWFLKNISKIRYILLENNNFDVILEEFTQKKAEISAENSGFF